VNTKMLGGYATVIYIVILKGAWRWWQRVGSRCWYLPTGVRGVSLEDHSVNADQSETSNPRHILEKYILKKN